MTAASRLPQASFDEASRDFMKYFAQASTTPLAINRDGQVGMVMLPFEEWQRLAKLERMPAAGSPD